MAENASLNLDDFIGKGFDDRDVRRITSLVSAMKNVVRKVRVVDNFLQVAFFPHALSLVAKLASQAEEAEPQGNGVLFCEAALALKRALGVRGDVEYTQDFDFENFNHGEDVAYLDTAFEGDGWRMEFQGRIQEGIRLNRRIEILAWKEAIRIFQYVSPDRPNTEKTFASGLAILDREEFAGPGFYDLVPCIVNKGDAFLQKAIEEWKYGE